MLTEMSLLHLGASPKFWELRLFTARMEWVFENY